MRKVSFTYYGKGLKEGTCKLEGTCSESGKKWSAIVKRPYPKFHWFWERYQDDYVVLRVSHRLAKEHKAPEWVFEGSDLL